MNQSLTEYHIEPAPPAQILLAKNRKRLCILYYYIILSFLLFYYSGTRMACKRVFSGGRIIEFGYPSSRYLSRELIDNTYCIANSGTKEVLIRLVCSCDSSEMQLYVEKTLQMDVVIPKCLSYKFVRDESE